MPDIDFGAFYSVEGMPGVAWTIHSYETGTVEVENYDEVLDEYFYDRETFDDTSAVLAVMVGDDQKHHINVEELTKIDEEDFCRECGQIGCGHG